MKSDGGGSQTVDVVIDKLVNGVKTYAANYGEEVTYTLNVGNQGNTNVTNAAIIDYLPAGVEYISGSAAGGGATSITYDPVARKLTWSGVNLPAALVFPLTFKAKYLATTNQINYTEVCSYNGTVGGVTKNDGLVGERTDTDSLPCNGTSNNEDDTSSATITPKGSGG